MSAGYWMSNAWGYVPYHPTDEELEDFRLDCGYDDDTSKEALYQLYQDDQDEVVFDTFNWATDRVPDIFGTVLSKLWQFENKHSGYGIQFPYDLVFEQLDGGWRMFLDSRYCSPRAPRDQTYWLAYCELTGCDTDEEKISISAYDAPNVEWKDFVAHVDKVADAVLWAFESYCWQQRLDIVWYGGSRPAEDKDFGPYKWREKWEEMFPEFK